VVEPGAVRSDQLVEPVRPASRPSKSVKSTVSSRRRDRERQNVRTRLLEAAREIAAEEGWQAVTIRRIADRLEYASPILYQHFAGKDALLLELVNVGFADLAERLRGVADAPAEQILTTLAETYWDFAFSSAQLYQAMHGLAGVPFGTPASPPAAQASFRVVRAELERLAAARNRTLRDPDGAVNTIWAFLHGFISLTMCERIAGGIERGHRLMLGSLPPLYDSMLE